MQTARDDQLIPLDKSWVIRMCVQELLYGDRLRALRQLDSQVDLADDLVALREILRQWHTAPLIDVGESGTLLRIFTFINWEQQLGKKITMHGTLPHRPINNDSSVVGWTQRQLLTLGNNTSQWATAAVLCGNKERLADPPFKLAVTYDAWQAWHASPEPELLHYDETIRAQADAFRLLQRTGKLQFTPRQAEDFPFAYVFDVMSPEQGQDRWPSLVGHESNRIVEVVEMKRHAENGEPVSSRDHRIVQAIAMWAQLHSRDIAFTHPNAVAKTWPRFWDWLNSSQ